MTPSDPRFLMVEGISYHQLGTPIQISVTRTPLYVVINGDIDARYREGQYISFQASSNPEYRGVSVQGGTYSGSDSVDFLKACAAAQTHLHELSETLSDFEGNAPLYLSRLKEEYAESMDFNYLLLLLAIRPVKMTYDQLEEAVSIVAAALPQKLLAGKRLKSHLMTLGDPWRYPVLHNALVVLGTPSDQDAIEEAFFDLAEIAELPD